MREWNDPKLLAQCARIREMIQQVAQDPKYQDDYYAKRYHHWQLSPPATLEEIARFERRAGVELPIEYVYYLTQVGRGGACPGTFFRDFDPEQKIYEHMDQASEQLAEELSEAEWEERFGCGWEGDREDGTLNLCGMDLTYVAYLIVTGPQRGRVVYMDYDNDMVPMWPKASPDFLTWCENFYSELLAGYDINPTWQFMWQEPGDEDALIRAFRQAGNVEYRKEVLLSFDKFPKLSHKAVEFLHSIREPEYREVIGKLLPFRIRNEENIRIQQRMFGLPQPGADYLDRPSAYGVAFDGQGRAAVVYCEGKGCFLLGGGMEPGETEEDCIRREALEETGFAVTVGKKVCIGEEYTTDRKGRPFHPIGHVYLIELGEKIAEPAEPDHALTWMPVEEFQRGTVLQYQSWAMGAAWDAYRQSGAKEAGTKA